MEERPPGLVMRREISERRVLLGSVPSRTSNTLLLRGGERKAIPFTGFELMFLGTSAGSPSVRRNPTAVCLRMERSNWMFDCAEGSLRQLMKSTIRVPSTDKFFITHLHGDHLYGLPGILCTLDNHNAAYVDSRTRRRVPRPISVYGPLGLFSYLNTAFATSSSRLTNITVTVHELVSPKMLEEASGFEKFMSQAPVHPCLRREMIFAESDGNNLIWKVFEDGDHRVIASTVKHSVTCFGYVVEEHDIPGKLKPEKLIAKGLKPGPAFRQLKHGKPLTLPSGEIIFPSDVLVHEATLSHEMVRQAVHRGHSTARMAGFTARRMNATLLALTHFSHRFRHWTAGHRLGTTQHLALEAQITFGRRAVIPASDFLRIPIPRRPQE
ncbi:hypothetical protein P43SY_008775 [Pythium insidiosum]|uniref:Uncharacterized protein n=1 Tax=Pythium insidiosum TaxID=114742 RepID=A0AAD5LK97_PYTIN|nr:hypothetical protein P43SY_008775 [Pythium insidiosum]